MGCAALWIVHNGIGTPVIYGTGTPSVVIFEDLVHTSSETAYVCRPKVIDYAQNGFPQKEYVFAAQICDDQTPDPEGRNISAKLRSFDRQIRQLGVLWKSMVLFQKTSQKLHFALVVQNDREFQMAMENILNWSQEYCSRMTFSKHMLVYPRGTKHLKYLNRPCASARFFFPHIFDHPNNGPLLISFDSDIIFMRPIEELWEHYHNFDEKQIFGISSMNTGMTENKKYASFPKLSHNGLEDGVNIGISLYNLSRWREFFPDKQDYYRTINKWYEQYGQYFFFPTQNLFDVWLAEHPEHYYELPCEWNMRRTFTIRALGFRTKPTRRPPEAKWYLSCQQLVDSGAKALHGAGGHFIDLSPGFFDVFIEFERFDMTNDTLKDLKDRLARRFSTIHPLKNYGELGKRAFLNQLFETIG